MMIRSIVSARWLRRTALGIAMFAVIGCDFLDPTEVDNPATTTDDLEAAEEPTSALLPGLRAQFARALNTTIPEVVSDNYSVHGTGINKTFDRPRSVVPSIVGGVYTLAQELHATAKFVLNDIVPGDATASDADVQEARYYLGISFLLLGERFTAVPTEENGAAVPSAALVQSAIDELETALSLDPSTPFATNIRGALARAYRQAGDAGQAETQSNAVLGADPMFAFGREYDAASVTNGPFAFLFLRSLKEMQPLPRGDFLDPKYTSREAPIYVSKAEEMHLILAEIAFSRSDYATGREEIALAIEVSQGRASEAFDDDDLRQNEDLTERPHDAVIEIRADASSPFRSGLVLTRPGTVITPTVSSTSLDADSIRAIPVSETESLRHALHLARQEMLWLEGRRMTDLGIRLPMTLAEIETNPNIDEGSLGTVSTVPDFIPQQDDMDLFDPASPYDADGNLIETMITIRVDMNRILAQNGFSPFGTLP